MKNVFVFLGLLAVSAAQITDDVTHMEALPKALLRDPRFKPVPPMPGGRIVGGVEAEPNSIPYQVGLQLTTPAGSSWCGGSLISDEWVLTAAHCTEEATSVLVYLGAHKIKEEEKDRVLLTVDKKEFIIHEAWNRNNLINDISLIHLPQKVKLNAKIAPIALPRKSDLKNDFATETDVVASGWGKDKDSATAVSPVLRKVHVPILNNKSCNTVFGIIKDSHICIDTLGGKSSCNGDSGGPLVVTGKDGIPILIGATSFGSGYGCEWGYPGAFTRITSFAEWISNKTGLKLRD